MMAVVCQAVWEVSLVQIYCSLIEERNSYDTSVKRYCSQSISCQPV